MGTKSRPSIPMWAGRAKTNQVLEATGLERHRQPIFDKRSRQVARQYRHDGPGPPTCREAGGSSSVASSRIAQVRPCRKLPQWYGDHLRFI